MKRKNGQVSKTKRIAILCILGALAGALNGCYFLPKEEAVLAPPLIDTPKVSINTVEVKKGNIERKITVPATFASAYQENLSFKFKGGILKTLNVKLGDNVKKGQLLAEQDTDSLLSQIKQQEIALRISELEYERQKASTTASSFDLDKASLNVQSTKLRLDDLKREYEKAKLYSTIAGDVVYVDSINPGDYANANKTLVTIADPTKILLQYKGDENGNFQQGVQVDVKYNGKDYKAEVVGNPYSIPLDANKNMRNSVFFKVNDLNEAVKIGDSASVILILDKKEDVIVIARSLVNNYGGRSYVQIYENGIKYERDIEIGLQTPTEVEVKKGLKEGDKIIQR